MLGTRTFGVKLTFDLYGVGQSLTHTEAKCTSFQPGVTAKLFKTRQ